MLQSKALEIGVCNGGGLGNLLQNAIKCRITVGCREIAVNRVEISVTDNGPGIPPEELPYIFSKFYRGKSVATEVAGAGLGLAIAKVW